MVAIQLQKCLCDEIENVTKDIMLKNPDKQPSKLKCFPQYLPKRDRDDKEDPYPYCIVRIVDGEKTDDGQMQIIKAFLIIGIYENEKERQGHLSLLNIIDRIDERFSKNNVIGCFFMDGTLEWTMQEDDTYPYYFAGITFSWKTMSIRREDDLA